MTDEPRLQAAPVFTVKLYRSPGADGPVTLALAPRLEFDRLGPDRVRLTLLGKSGAIEACYDISEAMNGPQTFAWAVIENPSGKTTEVIRPRARRVSLQGG